VIEAPDGGEFQFRYRAYIPDTPARALVVYLPQYGGTIDAWESSLLPQRLGESGIASLVGAPIPEGTGFMTDDSLQALHALLEDAMQRLQSPPDKLVLGGFSSGGVGAMRYGEVAVQGNLPGAFRPCAIFAVDPPIDLLRWYRGMQLIVQRNQPSIALDEAREIIQVLHYLLGGPPEEVPEAYAHASAGTAFAEQGGNLKYLREIPIRMYTEPDVMYFLEHLTDLYSLNALDVVFAVNELRAMGNEQAELIVTSGKGYRPDLGGKRLPHAWSIVDEPNLADWIEQKIR
jgi:hypothetical protein